MQKQEQYKALVNSYTQRNKIPPPLYHCNVEGFGEKRLFHATVVLGDHSFSTTNPYRTKRDAEFEAAKQACLQLQLSKGISSENQLQRSRTLGEQGSQNLHLSQSSKLKLPKGSIPVSCVEDVNRHLTDEILAVIFKSYLHHFSQEEQVSYPVYKTVQALENGLKGFTGEVLFKEKTFQCLGMRFSFIKMNGLILEFPPKKLRCGCSEEVYILNTVDIFHMVLYFQYDDMVIHACSKAQEYF